MQQLLEERVQLISARSTEALIAINNSYAALDPEIAVIQDTTMESMIQELN